MILDLTSWRRYDAVLSMLSGAQATIGRRTPHQFRHYGYDVVVDHQRDHEIDNDRRLLAALGVASTSAPHLELPKGATSPLPTPYVVFHLWPGGANFEERSWPTESWRTLAQAMNARGFAVVLTGGPGDAQVNRELADRWVADGIRAHNAAGTDWPDSLGWLGFASGAISVNTGVMHVAAALGHADDRAQRSDERPAVGADRSAHALRRVADGARRLPGPRVRARRALRRLHAGDHRRHGPRRVGRPARRGGRRRSRLTRPSQAAGWTVEPGPRQWTSREPGSLCIATVTSIGPTPRGEPTGCIGGPPAIPEAHLGCFLDFTVREQWVNCRTRWRRCSTRLP